jgi:hypothetical protein
LWGSIAASAHAEPRWRLLLVQPENSELITRIEGQTRDLGVQLQVVSGNWNSGSAEQAAALTADRGADFVARVQRTSAGVLEVRVYAAGRGSLRARPVPAHARSDRLSTSAELEAAALVLRGELNALIEAEQEAAQARERERATPAGTGSGSPPTAAGAPERGGPRSQQLPNGASSGSATARDEPTGSRDPARGEAATSEPPAVRDPATDLEPDEDEPEEPPDVPLENYSARRAAWTLRGGVRGSVPIDTELAVGALIGTRLQVAFFELGIALTTALPMKLTDPNVRIQLRRHSLSAEALGVIPLGPRFRALLGVDAGVVLYARTTDRVMAGLTRTQSENAWSATLGVQGELQWLVTRQLGFALGVGLSYLPLRTRFAYPGQSLSQGPEIAALRSLEPAATASVFGLFGE